jgi:hypothetical protein
MLKPYDQRVKATYELMRSFVDFVHDNNNMIQKLRALTKEVQKTQKEFPISWQLDRSKSDTILYKGYASGRKTSEVSGLNRLYYDRSKPFEKMIPFYDYYKTATVITKPKAYIIPQGWWKVLDLLKLNKVEMQAFKNDTTIEVQAYRIDDYKSAPRQYEMHHVNSDPKMETMTQKIKFRKGDYYIPMNQAANRFLIETLEPQAEDSYFSWNFFDAVLGQKEGFSGYSFEDIAAQYLKDHPDLKQKLEQRRATDTAFAKSASQQLNFVFQNSPYFEPVFSRYPVYRVL